MKQFHPAGHLVDNKGNRVGMIITEGFKPKKNSLARVVNNEQFDSLVQQNKMQLFTRRDRVSIVKYDKEEIKAYCRKHGPYTDKDYWDSDARFNVTDLGNNMHMAVCFMAMQWMINSPYLTSLIFRINPFRPDEIQDIKKIAQGTLARIADNLYYLGGNPAKILNYLKSYQYGFGINLDQMTHDNIIYQTKRFGLKNASKEGIENIVLMVQNMQG